MAAHFAFYVDHESDWLPNYQNAPPGTHPASIYTRYDRIYKHDRDGIVWLFTTLPGPPPRLALCARLVLAGGRMNHPTRDGYDPRYAEQRFAIDADPVHSRYAKPLACDILDGLVAWGGKHKLPLELSADVPMMLERFWNMTPVTPLHGPA